MDKPSGREFRVSTDTWPTEAIELRAEGDGMTFTGYAAVFDKWSEDLGGFRERIRPGAFTKTLGEKRAVKMFWNHNADIPLGSTRANLSLTQDDRGLLARAELPDTTHGRDMATLVRDGIVDSMSFGFQVIKDAWDKEDTSRAERELIEVRLWEVSPVTGWPAYPATSASVRDLAEAAAVEPDELAEAFRVLRDPDARLTADQRDLLYRVVGSKTDIPHIAPSVAQARERLAAMPSL